jgi:hypothetical protein
VRRLSYPGLSTTKEKLPTTKENSIEPKLQNLGKLGCER